MTPSGVTPRVQIEREGGPRLWVGSKAANRVVNFGGACSPRTPSPPRQTCQFLHGSCFRFGTLSWGSTPSSEDVGFGKVLMGCPEPRAKCRRTPIGMVGHFGSRW
jgi:hypothetical protein